MQIKYRQWGLSSLLRVIKPLVWLQILDQDLQNYSLYYPQCQNAQEQFCGPEREMAQNIVNFTL